MKILITGAGGQIGHDLIGALVAKGHDVVSTDLAPRPPSHAHAGGEWQRLDVTDAAAVQHTVNDVRPELVFHLAAILSARGEQDPQTAYDVNQTGTWNVLEACRLAKVNRLLFTSSIAVFGPPPSGPLPDPTPDDVALHPGTMYGVTKVAGELLCAYYRKRYGIDCRGVRFPGLISAAMPGGGSSDYALFMYVDGVRKGAYDAFARADTRIPLMYMPDGVRALLELAMAPREKLTRTIYNIAAFSPRADEIAKSVQRQLPDAKFTFTPDELRQGILDSWPKALDDSAARRDWGWAPKYDLDAMTDDLVPRVRRMLEARRYTHALMNIVDEMFAVTQALEAAGIQYAVCGGLAVSMHGYVRATDDIDILILPGDVKGALAAVAPLGFVFPATPITFGAGTVKERHIQRVSKIDGTNTLTLDLLLADAAYEGALDGAFPVTPKDTSIVIVSRARLLQMKRLAGRHKDLADLEYLENGEDDV